MFITDLMHGTTQNFIRKAKVVPSRRFNFSKFDLATADCAGFRRIEMKAIFPSI